MSQPKGQCEAVGCPRKEVKGKRIGVKCNKLPSGVPFPKHKPLFAIAYGATEAHPARYAKDEWKKAEAQIGRAHV